MSYENVFVNMRAAARQQVLTVTGLWAARAWDYKQFQPTPGTPYVAEVLKQISSQKAAIGTNSLIRHRGMAIFSLFAPLEYEANVMEAMQGKVAVKFKPGTVLNYGGDRFTVTDCNRRDGERGPSWNSCLVLVDLMAYTTT